MAFSTKAWHHADSLIQDDFYDEANRAIFGACKYLAEQGGEISATLVRDRLRSTGNREKIDAAYFARLSENVCHSDFVADHANVIRNHAVRRSIISSAVTATEDSRNLCDPIAVVDQLRASCDEAMHRVSSYQRPGTEVFKDSQSVLARRLAGDKDDTYLTGFQGFEIGKGLLTVLGAPPGTGKTQFAIQCAFKALENHDELRLVIANAETVAEELLVQELCRRAEVNYSNLRQGKPDPDDQERLDEQSDVIKALMPRCFFLREPCTATHLAQMRSQGPGLLVVDYLQKFYPPEHDELKGIGAVMKILRSLCSDGWGVICISATSRQSNSKQRHNHSQLDSGSFRGSSEIEYNADVAYVIRRDPGSTNATLACVKRRFGPAEDTEMVFEAETMRFVPEAEESNASDHLEEGSFDYETR